VCINTIQKREKIDKTPSGKCSDWMRFREDVMMNSKEMESIMSKLPLILKNRVALALYQV
jgi:hypothetical protein